MSSLVPVDGTGPEQSASLDDLLPAGPPAEPPPVVPDAPPPARSPQHDPPSQSEIEEIESLHDEVMRASAACESSLFGGKGRRHLKAVLRSEEAALRQLGCTSYADFALAARSTGWQPGADRSDQPAEPAANGSLAAAVPEHAAPDAAEASPASTWRAELTQLQPREPDTAEEIRRELDETRLALRLSQEELDRTRADLADATTVRVATDSAAEAGRVELEQERARAELATAEVTHARQALDEARAEMERNRHELDEARAEVERHRHALAEAGTRSSADDDALRQRVEQLEQRVALEQSARVAAEAEAMLANEQLAEVRAEAEDLQHRVGASTEHLEARLAAVRDEAARAVDEAAHAQDARCAELEAELAAAHERVAQAGTDEARAIRSRDAAVDEVANARTQLEELGSELAATRSELARTREDQEQAVVAATEAAGREAQRTAELERAGAELAAMRDEAAAAEARHATELDAARTELDAARTELDTTRTELDATRSELEAARADVGATRTELDTTRTELDTTRSELDAARADVDAARTELDAIRAELDATRRELDAARTEIEELTEATREPAESTAAAIAAADELVRVTELARARVEAERELTDVVDRVEQLQEKRRRLKRRIEQQRSRFTAEHAALDLELAWNREQAGAQLAVLEHHVAAVSTDAETLRARLAAARATLPPGSAQDDPGGPAMHR